MNTPKFNSKAIHLNLPVLSVLRNDIIEEVIPSKYRILIVHRTISKSIGIKSAQRNMGIFTIEIPNESIVNILLFTDFPFLIYKLFILAVVVLAGNVLQLPEGGDLEALHYQSSTNFDRSTMLDLTTEPPLLGRCCYAFVVFPLSRFFSL